MLSICRAVPENATARQTLGQLVATTTISVGARPEIGAVAQSVSLERCPGC
jgi:hypothetical protein